MIETSRIGGVLFALMISVGFSSCTPGKTSAARSDATPRSACRAVAVEAAAIPAGLEGTPSPPTFVIRNSASSGQVVSLDLTAAAPAERPWVGKLIQSPDFTLAVDGVVVPTGKLGWTPAVAPWARFNSDLARLRGWKATVTSCRSTQLGEVASESFPASAGGISSAEKWMAARCDSNSVVVAEFVDSAGSMIAPPFSFDRPVTESAFERPACDWLESSSGPVTAKQLDGAISRAAGFNGVRMPDEVPAGGSIRVRSFALADDDEGATATQPDRTTRCDGLVELARPAVSRGGSFEITTAPSVFTRSKSSESFVVTTRLRWALAPIGGWSRPGPVVTTHSVASPGVWAPPFPSVGVMTSDGRTEGMDELDNAALGGHLEVSVAGCEKAPTGVETVGFAVPGEGGKPCAETAPPGFFETHEVLQAGLVSVVGSAPLGVDRLRTSTDPSEAGDQLRSGVCLDFASYWADPAASGPDAPAASVELVATIGPR